MPYPAIKVNGAGARGLGLSPISTVSSLGGFYRRLAARKGGRVALKALARKLAEWYYRVLRYGRASAEHELRVSE